MVRLLIGIREDVPPPAAYVEGGDPQQRPYRVREGVHRYHASLALGFSHIPAEIVEGAGKPNLLGKNTHHGYLVQKVGGRNEKDYRIFDVGSFD